MNRECQEIIIIKKKPNKMPRIIKYNHWNKTFTRVQWQIWVGRRNNQWTWKWGNLNNPGWREHNKKKKLEKTLRDLWDTTKHTNICIMRIPEKKEHAKKIWKNNSPKSPKVDKRSESTYPRSSTNSKRENLNKIRALRLYCQRQGENRNLKRSNSFHTRNPQQD